MGANDSARVLTRPRPRGASGSTFGSCSCAQSVAAREPTSASAAAGRDQSGVARSESAATVDSRRALPRPSLSDDCAAEALTAPLLQQSPLLRAPAAPRHALQGDDDVHTLMLVFALPSTVTPRDQRCFQRDLTANSVTSTQFIANAFRALVTTDTVRTAMWNAKGGNILHSICSARIAEGSTTQALFTKTPPSSEAPSRLTTHANTKDFEGESEEYFEDSLKRARKCAIQFTLNFLEYGLNESCKDIFLGCESESGDIVKVKKFTSPHRRQYFVCVRLRRDVAEFQAAFDEYPVQLSHAGIDMLGIDLKQARNTVPAYVKYDTRIRDICQTHVDCFGNGKSVLRQIDRVRILYDKITDFIDLNQLRGEGFLVQCQPLHNASELAQLKDSWASLRLIFSLRQPIDEVRAYFGEEVALYFLFLQELTYATLFLAVPGGLLHLWKYVDGVNPEDMGWGCRLFSLLTMLWYRIVAKRWKQLELEAENKWGVDAHRGSLIKQLRNIRFRGKLMPSPENACRLQPGASEMQKQVGRALSLFLTVLFLLVLLAFISVEHFLFFHVLHDVTSPLLHNVLFSGFGAFCGCQIKAIDYLWDSVSSWITDLELRPFEVDYANSKRLKASIVKFITSTVGMYFFAFVEPLRNSHPEDATPINRQHARANLERNLLSMFLVRYILLARLNSVWKPYSQFRRRCEAARKLSSSCKLYPEEVEAEMPEYGNTELTDDWLDVLLPLGMTIFFAMVSPITALLLFCTLLLQTRTDAWKLVHVYRRRYPQIHWNIQPFESLLFFYGYLMIFTNVGLVFVEFGGVVRYVPDAWWQSVLGRPQPEDLWLVELLLDALAFILICSALAFLWRFVDFVLPGVTLRLRLERRRQDLQRHHLYYHYFGGSKAPNLDVHIEIESEAYAQKSPRRSRSSRSVASSAPTTMRNQRSSSG